MKTKFKLVHFEICIKMHWVFIKVYRKEMDFLIMGEEIIISKRLSRIDKLLNYHCFKIIQLEYKYALIQV